MHDNANIAFELQETRQVLSTLLAMQPRLAVTPGSTTPDQQAAALAASILDQLPPLLSMAEAGPGVFERTQAGQLNSMAVVLRQEMERFNRLGEAMRASLEELQKGLKGLAVMSQELEHMSEFLIKNQVSCAACCLSRDDSLLDGWPFSNKVAGAHHKRFHAVEAYC